MIARTSSSAWVRGVVEMFAAEGIDVEALFRDAGLDMYGFYRATDHQLARTIIICRNDYFSGVMFYLPAHRIDFCII